MGLVALGKNKHKMHILESSRGKSPPQVTVQIQSQLSHLKRFLFNLFVSIS